jgi:hypothetical protein
MSNHKSIRQVPIRELVRKKEEVGLRFFRECINRTNQFSAQFILKKVINNYTDHVNAIDQEFQNIPPETVDQKLAAHLEEKFSPKDLCVEFDLSTLTFLEAAKIVIRMAERDIDFYKYFIKREINKSTQKALKNIVVQKTAYMDKLRNEYSRLDHQR